MFCISISHRKAPAHIREQYAFTSDEQKILINTLIKKKYVEGCVFLCTCNRSEIYFSKVYDEVNNAFKCVISEIAFYLDDVELRTKDYINYYEGTQAVTHLFKVCSGFDSKIFGEDEILRQVKVAYENAKEMDGTNYELNLIFQKAITCAKRIKTDTKISRIPISIATLVANEAFHWKIERPYSELSNQNQRIEVLLIGISGKMGTDIAKNLLCKSDVHIIATVRNHNSTLNVSYSHDQIKVIPYAKRYEYIDQVDIVISATASPHFVITENELYGKLSGDRKRLFIDLAIPRDMDPRITSINGICLRNIDYFDTLSTNNILFRLEEADRAEMILEEERELLLKELSFHRYYNRIPEWKKIFEEIPLEKLLFLMKKKLNLEELENILEIFDHLKDLLS